MGLFFCRFQPLSLSLHGVFSLGEIILIINGELDAENCQMFKTLFSGTVRIAKTYQKTQSGGFALAEIPAYPL